MQPSHVQLKGDVTFNVAGGNLMLLNDQFDNTVGGAITVAGSAYGNLVLSSTGGLTPNWVIPSLQLNSGNLQVAAGHTLATTGVVGWNGGSIALTSDNTAPAKWLVAGDITASAGGVNNLGTGTQSGIVDLSNGTPAVPQTRTITVNGAANRFSISASVQNGGIIKAGDGTLQLSGDNTQGLAPNAPLNQVTINNGTVLVTSAAVGGVSNALGSAPVSLGNGTLKIGEASANGLVGKYYVNTADVGNVPGRNAWSAIQTLNDINTQLLSLSASATPGVPKLAATASTLTAAGTYAIWNNNGWSGRRTTTGSNTSTST